LNVHTINVTQVRNLSSAQFITVGGGTQDKRMTPAAMMQTMVAIIITTILMLQWFGARRMAGIAAEFRKAMRKTGTSKKKMAITSLTRGIIKRQIRRVVGIPLFAT